MSRNAPAPVRAATVTHIPNRARANVRLFDGSALNVDYASYLAQHDVLYQAPPLSGSEGMPIGDGDLGAMLWCPERLRFQVQKSDLWSDPPDGADASGWRQVSAGAVSVCAEPSFLRNPDRFEQRLCLHSGTVTIQSENSQGACQVTTFVSASAGVLVIHYADQSVRSVERRVDIHLKHNAHLFAVGESAGALQAFQDRRYALLARVDGAKSTARVKEPGISSLIVDGSRSSELTIYVAVATSPRNGDPVAMARSRIETAISKGYERLLVDQRQHWGHFWEKSFLRLKGDDGDPLPHYLENLWYLGLYQQACCSRGYDAPLANGGLWLTGEDTRGGPALYAGRDMRALLANLIPANHLELSVPYVDTYYRMLPKIAASTGSELGLAGARFPAGFNRHGEDPEPAPQGGSRGSTADDARREIVESLDTGLLVYEAWRHAPDPFFLRERAYPLLRAATVFAIERCQSAHSLWYTSEIRARIGAALRALLWADREHELEEELRHEWEQLMAGLRSAESYAAPDMRPFGALSSRDSAGLFRSLIGSVAQQPCGFFGESSGSPDLAFMARLCGGLSGILLNERSVTGVAPAARRSGSAVAFGGGAPNAIEVFTALPDSWGGAFSMIAPGGFRVSAEAAQGRACYVAVKSLLGGLCRIVNPWGAGERVRILRGRMQTVESAAAVLEFPTEPNTAYLIEREEMSYAHAAVARLIGKPNTGVKECGGSRLGIPPKVQAVPGDERGSRLPSETAVVSVMSRVERARLNLREQA